MITIKKGEIILRDVVFIMLIISSVLIFSSTFVTEIASNYGNDEMSDEFGLSNLSMTNDGGMLSDLKTTTENISSDMQNKGDDSGGLWTLAKIGNTLDIVVSIIWSFLTAPAELGGLVGDIVTDMGATAAVGLSIKYIITIGLWLIVIFAVVTAFLRGAKV